VDVSNQLIEDLPAFTLADDLLEGATEIAEFIFGSGTHARRAHTAMAGKRNPLPHFQLGGRLYARKSVIVRWIADQERRKSKVTETPRSS
jgi:hypothetical protein